MSEINKNKTRQITKEELEVQRDYTSKIKLEILNREAKPLAFVETYGCQQNSSDSEKIKGMLYDMGYDFTDSTENADLVIYNTCAVRENAELKVFGNIGALKHKKLKNPEMIIGVCGCMMQQEHIASRIKSKYKHVDMVFGTHALYRFPQILSKTMNESKVFDIEPEAGAIFEEIAVKRDAPPIAKIPIMYGCNNYCTYCIVPYVRGRERSRDFEDILAEAQNAAKDGYKEIMLLGQNVNSYGNDINNGFSFAELLKKVCEIDGIERIRFVTSHPKDISDELIEVMTSEPKICKQLHLPIQCGSDKILEKMNRKYTKSEYLEKIKKIKTAIPEIVLTTDIIVGFPGETYDDFLETINVLKEVEYDMIYSFIYSKRIGTPAADMPDCLTDAEKHKNFDEMLSVQNAISRRKNEEYTGTIQTVLVEGPSKNDKDVLTGRSDGGKIVNFVAKNQDNQMIGKLVDVRIKSVNTWSMVGEII